MGALRNGQAQIEVVEGVQMRAELPPRTKTTASGFHAAAFSRARQMAPGASFPHRGGKHLQVKPHAPFVQHQVGAKIRNPEVPGRPDQQPVAPNGAGQFPCSTPVRPGPSNQRFPLALFCLPNHCRNVDVLNDETDAVDGVVLMLAEDTLCPERERAVPTRRAIRALWRVAISTGCRASRRGAPLRLPPPVRGTCVPRDWWSVWQFQL